MSIVFVQAAQAALAGPTSTPSATWGSPATAGNLIVASISWTALTGTDVSSVVDGGDTFTRGASTITSGTRQMSIWYCLSTGGGGTLVRFNMAAAITLGQVEIAEYSGVSSFDLAIGSASGTGTVATSGSFTPAAGGETVMCHGWATLGGTAGTNYTARNVANTGVNSDRIGAPAGAQTATFNVTEGGCCGCVPEPWIIMGLVFKPTASVIKTNATFFGVDA